MDIICSALYLRVVDLVVLVSIGALAIIYIVFDAFYGLGNKMREHAGQTKRKQKSIFDEKHLRSE